MTVHPMHKTRSSDASTFDEICIYCGATDSRGSYALEEPCTVTKKTARDDAEYLEWFKWLPQEEQRRIELERVCSAHNVSPPSYCKSGRDGDCIWIGCPQERDGEPKKTSRHCPLDIHQDWRYHQ